MNESQVVGISVFFLILLVIYGGLRFLSYWGAQESQAQVRRMQRYMQANRESK